MPKQAEFTDSWSTSFIEGAARALFVQAWGDREEERGRTYPGEDLMDVAPKTPKKAYIAAGKLLGELVAANNASVHELIQRAAKADHVDEDEIDVENFGHYVAMQYVGSGVGWTDDHAAFGLKVPHGEFYL